MSPYGPALGRVTADQAATLTRPDGDAVLLDVREQHEWDAGHAPHAIHLPMRALNSGTVLPTDAQRQPLVIICRSGSRSRHATALLSSLGIDAVDVIDGMRAWAAAGLPVIDAHGKNGSIA
ncbi:rhodanese-like domain-containing protein [Streptomyces sp. NPDC006339]|uniref:rhodanese-like domain-containing protein n=1 Tax=Streptomyces sp. NPDC006339 TaxID=3156755 RepID=UPI0033B10129